MTDCLVIKNRKGEVVASVRDCPDAIEIIVKRFGSVFYKYNHSITWRASKRKKKEQSK